MRKASERRLEAYKIGFCDGIIFCFAEPRTKVLRQMRDRYLKAGRLIERAQRSMTRKARRGK